MSWGLRQVRNGFFAQDEYKKKMDGFRKRQTEMLENETKFIPPIIDMKSAYSKVRQNNTTIAPSLYDATTTKTYK
tara:strand:+ start:103 stop:327 length:225 start_codon:yes stop_codon:yes gene_type:complete